MQNKELKNQQPLNFNKDCELFYLTKNNIFGCANLYTPDEEFDCECCLWNKKKRGNANWKI